MTTTAPTRASEQAHPDVQDAGHVDVLIVGAGVSGIGAAHHLRERFPDRNFAILDAQDNRGGTWWTHRDPGGRPGGGLGTPGRRRGAGAAWPHGAAEAGPGGPTGPRACAPTATCSPTATGSSPGAARRSPRAGGPAPTPPGRRAA